MNTRGTFSRVALVVVTSGGASGCGFAVPDSPAGTSCPDLSQGPAPSHATTTSDDAGCSSWSCDTGWVDCGGGPCSVNVLTDPRQCGDCGNRCPDGVCTMGSCGQVDVLTTGLSSPGAVAVDSTSVYFADTTPLLLLDGNLYLGGTLLVRTPLAGGSVQLVAKVPGSVSELAVDSTGAYYLAAPEVVLVPPPTASGASAPVVVGSTSVSAAVDVDASDPDGGALTSFAVGGGSVWWLRTFGGVDGGDGGPASFDLVRESEADSGVQRIATAPIVAPTSSWLELTGSLAIGGGDAFFASNGALEVVRAGSSTVETLAAEPQSVIDSVALDDTYVYWTWLTFSPGADAPQPPALARMLRDGGPVETLLPSSSSLSQLVVSDGLAWGTQPGIAGDDLVRVDGPGAVTVLSGGLGTIGGVAVDGTSVYWTVTAQGTSGAGQLLRADR